MSKMSRIDQVITELKKCEERLVNISEELTEIFSGSREKVALAVKLAKEKKKEYVKAQETGKNVEKQYSFTEIKTIPAEKSKEGYTVVIKDILQKQDLDIQRDIKRVFDELGITSKKYLYIKFFNGNLVYPYKKYDVLLVLIENLHKLPVVESWEGLDCAASENYMVRAVISHRVLEEWTRRYILSKKNDLKNKVFLKPDVHKQIMEKYCKEELAKYNPEEQIDYFIERIINRIEKLNIPWKLMIRRETIDSKRASMEILGFFKRWVENNKGWEVIQDANSRKKEKIVQRIIHFSGLCYIQTNNLALSCEPDEGRGPVDFKVSRGQDVTIIEVKLSTNSEYCNGFKYQIEEYGKAENTDNMIYVFIDLGNSGRVKTIEGLYAENLNKGRKMPELIIIDAKEKVSASITK